MNPQFPIYIVSKGRWETRITAKHLEAMNVPYFIVVEEQEYPLYTKVIPRSKVLVLDKQFQRDYDAFDNLGDTKSKGPGPARNFAWEHSIASGASWHWVMDDNIAGFVRLNQNRRIPVTDGTIFRCMEDFVVRYMNIAMAGPDYRFFVDQRQKLPPYITNTRIYSCNLIRNDVPFRWRGRYNEDTDISLRMLKANLCTVQFYAFLQNKINTQKVAGGNTAEFYSKEGTYPKSKMLYEMHPDVTRIVMKYNRWHHHVDYRGFQRNTLIRRPDAVIPNGTDNYGMELVKVRA